MAKIISIVYQPKATDVKHGEFHRVPIDTVKLIANHGIEDDHKAGRNPKRHLNIMMRETLDDLAEVGFKTAPGEMGEQIQIQGIDIESLPIGTHLKIGESAVVRLNKPRTGCIWLEHIQGQSYEQTANKLGIMATVLETGDIHIGDTVSVIPIPEPAL